MKVMVGVDGCRSGWIAVGYEENGECGVRLFGEIRALCEWAGETATVLIDIPIGLWESGPDGRACDVRARRLLGAPRSSSVFTPPCRAALKARSWTEAAQINERWTGKRLSRQAWGIARKIREVDAYLREDTGRQEHLREAHPELFFWALNEKRAMRHSKKGGAGRQERLAVLAPHWPEAPGVFDREYEKLRRNGAAPDDLIDAMAFVAGWRGSGGRFETVPDNPACDSAGLRMEIVYPRV